MSYIYKVIIAITISAISQLSLAAFPNDLYGFKTGDSWSTTQTKFKNKYGKMIVLDSGYSTLEKKCGMGSVSRLKIDDETEIDFNNIQNFKVMSIHVSKKMLFSNKEEILSFTTNAFSNYGQPTSIQKDEFGVIRIAKFENNAEMVIDWDKVDYWLFGYDSSNSMGKISENCVSNHRRSSMP